MKEVRFPAPTKGVVPNTHGVAGELVDAVPPDVLFGERKRKTSPYDPLLLQLSSAGAGKFLRFPDLRARVSLKDRAKRLGIKIVFGEQGSVLWVALAKVELHVDGQTEPQPKAKAAPDLVLEAVGGKHDTPGLITTWVRANGAPGISITVVDKLLTQLARDGMIQLKPKRVGDEADRWMLRPDKGKT